MGSAQYLEFKRKIVNVNLALLEIAQLFQVRFIFLLAIICSLLRSRQ